MDSAALKATVQQLLAQQEVAIDKAHKERKRYTGNVAKRDIELAVTVLLVDLASSDQDFDPAEYQVIVRGLMRMFGTPKHEVSALVNQAQNVLRNMRGIGRFGATLKDNLSLDERETVMDVIEEVIAADGVEDDYEIFLRQKLKGLLGLD
ncbi:MAG: TerB family tellurite resistance protein [Bdellovibrionales bacterium]|nr:TerB family tellurite resistance protein [Bdellovibrionales bacterium]